jgi:hypothetical protein
MAGVVSEIGKGGANRQVRVGKVNVSEPLMTCRKRWMSSKSDWAKKSEMQCGRSLLTARAVTGIKAARAPLRRLCGTWEPGVRCQGKTPSGGPTKGERTDADARGGRVRSSGEAQ